MTKDYAEGEVYAATAHLASFRLFSTLTAILGHHTCQCDAVTAFLNAVTKKEAYVRQPYGHEDGTERVCKLTKALYGLAKSPVW